MPKLPGRSLGRGLSDRHGTRGQSMVEFALVLPVLLLIVLVAIDFGRVYLGYVNLQQMARVAAGFAAEHASAWELNDTATIARYDEMVANDAAAINCELPETGGVVDVPDPAFPGGFTLGDPVQVKFSCSFAVLTPIISGILGNTILVGADVVYPIREGAVAEVPGGGGAIALAPVAKFLGTPLSGYEPLEVTLTDQSLNVPTSWVWDFGIGDSFDQGPHTITYDCPATVPQGGSCDYTVSLTVGSDGGFDTTSKTITVYVPPDTGPIAEFEGTPLSGLAPLAVDFDFIDVRALDADLTNDVVYTNFQWDFEDDGTWDTSGASETSVSHTYTQPGVYDVRLQVTDDQATPNVHYIVKQAYVVASKKVCTVPDFAGVRRNAAQARWDAAEFTTTVQFLPGNGNYTIHSQSLVGGVVDPQPDGCDSVITVGP
jgi:PKD repeat protein